MSTWQIAFLLVITGCATGCLLAIFRALDKLAKGVLSIGTQLTKMNAKLEAIETVNRDEANKPFEQCEPGFEDLEAAISNFEKLKRVEHTKQG